MRIITVFDFSDFELLVSENDFNINAKKEWEEYRNRKGFDCDSLLDYEWLHELVYLVGGFKFEEIDKVYDIIKKFEADHPDRYDNIKRKCQCGSLLP